MLQRRKLTGRLAATLGGALCMASSTLFGSALAAGLELRGAGSTLAAPLYSKWIEVFTPSHPGVAMKYSAVGSGEGVASFKRDTVDFGASDVPLTADKAAKIERGVVQVPVTAGMVVLAYNLPGIAGELKLPQDVYADIFSGRITNWDDAKIRAANPGLKLPAKNIAVVVRQDSSGTTFAFTSHLAAASKKWSGEGHGVGTIVAWPQGSMIARGNEGVASRIKISDGSIGYVEYGFARRLGLKVALLQNKEGKFVAPSPDSGAAAMVGSAQNDLESLAASIINPAGAEAYPIVTYSWMLLHKSYAPDKASALKSFASYALGDGQKNAVDLGYISLPLSVAALGKTAVAQISADAPAGHN